MQRLWAVPGIVVFAVITVSSCAGNDEAPASIQSRASQSKVAVSRLSTVPATATIRGHSPPGVWSIPPKTTTAAAAVGRCNSHQLRLSRMTDSAASGVSYIAYQLLDVAAPTCRLNGYPGVSQVDAHGDIIGQPATWRWLSSGAAPPTSTMRPGEIASFLLVVVGDANAPPTKKCFRSAVPTQLRVFPPGQTQPLTLGPITSWAVGECATYVTPIQVGPTPTQ